MYLTYPLRTLQLNESIFAQIMTTFSFVLLSQNIFSQEKLIHVNHTSFNSENMLRCLVLLLHGPNDGRLLELLGIAPRSVDIVQEVSPHVRRRSGSLHYLAIIRNVLPKKSAAGVTMPLKSGCIAIFGKSVLDHVMIRRFNGRATTSRYGQSSFASRL